MSFWWRRCDGAVAVAQVHEVAVAVGEHLHLDVARRGQVALDEQRAVAEGALGQAPRGRQRRRRARAALAHDLHALAAAARGRLDDERQPGTSAPRARGWRGPAPRPHSPAAPARRPPRMRVLATIFEPMAAMARAGGPTNTSPASAHACANCGVLGQEAVARVDGLGAAGARRGEDARHVEVAVARAARDPGARASSASAHVARVRVGIGVHRDGAHAEAARGAEDAAGDLAAVGDQQALDHAPRLHPEDAEARRVLRARGAPRPSDRASTRRVSSGSMTPSSHSRAEE